MIVLSVGRSDDGLYRGRRRSQLMIVLSEEEEEEEEEEEGFCAAPVA
jgi:hypothetical protein